MSGLQGLIMRANAPILKVRTLLLQLLELPNVANINQTT